MLPKTFLLLLLLAAAVSNFFLPVAVWAQGGSTGQSSSDLTQPIKVRNSELLRRDLEGLARRHNLPLPDSTAISHQDLGEYFLRLMPKLAELRPEDFSSQDLYDIGVLTEEFERSIKQVKGTIALRAFKTELPEQADLSAKIAVAHARLTALENTKITGDFTFAPQSDMGRQDHDSMSANLRARINLTSRVVEGKDGTILGDGFLFTRLTAAAGRFFPRNKYLLSPLNDIVDANASPFNSGIGEVQVPTLFINNNNSNSLRPTFSLEQAYYSQDLKFAKDVKGNFKAGLIYLGAFFDNNNYANSELLQFMNTSFVNSISWRANFNGPALMASAEKPFLRDKMFLRGTAALATITNRDVFGCYGYNYELQLGHKFFQKEGNARVGFWNWSFRSGTAPPFVTPTDLIGTAVLPIIPGGTADQSPKPVGMYLNFDQKIWKDIGLWGRYAFNDKNIGQVFLGGLLSSRNSWSFGAEIPMKVVTKKRPDDVIGVAWGQIGPYTRGTIAPATPAFVGLNGVIPTTLSQVNANVAAIDPGTSTRNEKVLEAYYRYQINKNVSISPDIQYIWSPGGTGPQPGIFAIGSRLTVVF